MKRIPIVYIALIIITIWVACKSNDKKTPAPPTNTEDSTLVETPDSVFSTETLDTFNTLGFSTWARQKSQQFSWDKFKMTTNWTEDSPLVASFHPDKAYFENYGRLFKYSPDSSQFIDLDSYNISITKNSKGQLVGTESGPDTEVSLVNTHASQKTRLLFMGPGNSVEDALWLDDENLVLMGVQLNDSSGQASAAVWKYNVPTKTFILYELPDSAIASQLLDH